MAGRAVDEKWCSQAKAMGVEKGGILCSTVEYLLWRKWTDENRATGVVSDAIRSDV